MTTQASSRSPEPQEVLRMAVEYALSDVHTALPGRIETYDSETQKADVKPLIQRRVVGEDGTELLEELPVLPQVPVVFPRSSGFHVTFPLAAGDHVLLVFNERSIDNFIAGDGGDTDPDEYRMHDLSDAVAYPGFYPDSKAIQDIDTERMSLGADAAGMNVHIAQDNVEVTFDSGVTVKLEGKDADAKLTLGDGAKHAAIVEALETLWGNLNTWLDAHTHPTGVGPSGPPAPPLSSAAGQAPWDSAINSSKVSFPDG